MTKYMKANGIKPNYQNLKTQCAFKLSSMFDDISIEDPNYRDMVQEELDVIVEINMDGDVRKIISKEKIKEQLGRSPNFFDCMMMRMRAEMEETTELNIF